jgi:hypothetical protein
MKKMECGISLAVALLSLQAQAAYDCKLTVTESVPVRVVNFKMKGKPDFANLPKEAIVSEQVLNPQLLNEKQLNGAQYSSGPDGVSEGVVVYRVTRTAIEEAITIQDSCGFENAQICLLNIESASSPANATYMNVKQSEDRSAKFTQVGAVLVARTDAARDKISLSLGAMYTGLASDTGEAKSLTGFAPGQPLELSVEQSSHKVAGQSMAVITTLNCSAK